MVMVICYIAIENGPVEIVDYPMNSMVDLSSSLGNKLPEGRLQIRGGQGSIRVQLASTIECGWASEILHHQPDG